jgi:hypothetical protein
MEEKVLTFAAVAAFLFCLVVSVQTPNSSRTPASEVIELYSAQSLGDPSA